MILHWPNSQSGDNDLPYLNYEKEGNLGLSIDL